MSSSGGHKPPQGPKSPQQPEKPEVLPIPNDPDVPDVYAEGVYLYVTYNSFIFTFNKALGKQPANSPVAVVRMSPQQAFLMMQILRKSLKEYERDVAKFVVPDQLLKSMGIEIEGEL